MNLPFGVLIQDFITGARIIWRTEQVTKMNGFFEVFLELSLRGAANFKLLGESRASGTAERNANWALRVACTLVALTEDAIWQNIHYRLTSANLVRLQTSGLLPASKFADTPPAQNTHITAHTPSRVCTFAPARRYVNTTITYFVHMKEREREKVSCAFISPTVNKIASDTRTHARARRKRISPTQAYYFPYNRDTTAYKAHDSTNRARLFWNNISQYAVHLRLCAARNKLEPVFWNMQSSTRCDIKSISACAWVYLVNCRVSIKGKLIF